MVEGVHEPDRASIFVVHGRNDAARDSMFDFLRAINLRPIEWSQAIAMTGSGTPFIGEVLNVAFDRAYAAVVLLTPDEIAYLRPEYASGAHDPDTVPGVQPRPNVLFEAGMALGRKSERVVIAELGELRGFSDTAGRHVVRLDNSSTKRRELARRLQNMGCPVDLSGDDWERVGDFTPPPPAGAGLPLGRRVPPTPQGRRVSLDLRYHERSKGGAFEIINNGTEALYDVNLTLPDEVQYMQLYGDGVPIARLPPGKSATIPCVKFMGRGPTHFDATLTGRTEDGSEYSEAAFVSTA